MRTAAPRWLQALMAASENGKLPILTDTSPCLAQMKQGSDPAMKFSLVSVRGVGFAVQPVA
jgi:hypothetical protein